MLLAFVACTPKGLGRTTVVHNGITMTVSLAPNPPHLGPQAVNVTIADRNGHGIEGAFVQATLLIPQRPTQSEQAYEDGVGRYSMPFLIDRSGPARFVITVKVGKSMLRATAMVKV